ncbi:unnamed protein product [Discosporangium mesarthrocarpum]
MPPPAPSVSRASEATEERISVLAKPDRLKYKAAKEGTSSPKAPPASVLSRGPSEGKEGEVRVGKGSRETKAGRGRGQSSGRDRERDKPTAPAQRRPTSRDGPHIETRAGPVPGGRGRGAGRGEARPGTGGGQGGLGGRGRGGRSGHSKSKGGAA